MLTPSPRRVLTWCIRTLYVTAPLTVLLFLSWAFRWNIFFSETRPFLVLMAYLLLLMVSGAAAGVALLAGAHMAIHEAFRAGLQAGLAASGPHPRRALRRQARTGPDPLLQLVDTPHNHRHSDA